MIQSVNFDFDKIEKELEKTNKKINFKIRHIKKMKYDATILFLLGLTIGTFILISGFLYNITKLSNASIQLNNILIEIIKTILFSGVIGILLGIAMTLLNTNSRLSLTNYITLKRLIKNKYETYKYITPIDAIYRSTKVGYRSSYVKNNKKIVFDKKYITPKGNILVINNQKIYIDDIIYNDIINSKNITLYFVKTKSSYIIFDYKKID